MIPLFNVLMSPDALRMVKDTLYSGQITQGGRVVGFENELSKVFGHPVLATNSCTSAIDLAMHLCGVGPGDEVITTPVTCTATNSPIVTRRAIPVWSDVDRVTALIDPRDVARKITSKTKAIVVVDWCGDPVDCGKIRKVCRGLPIIQDAAHSFGAIRTAQTSGDYICWSFQAIKHLTTGDGGAIATPPDQFERARLLRWFGLDRTKPGHRFLQNIQEVGYKYHMNDISASIGLANLPMAIESVKRHRGNARYYQSKLGGLKNVSVAPHSKTSSHWLYMILVENRDGFMDFSKERGFESTPAHGRNDVHLGFNYPNGSLDGTQLYCSKNAAIPCGWWVGESERKQIANSVIEWDSMT